MKHEKQQSVLFTAELQHSEETFYRLARVQAQLYGALGKVFVIFCGFALITAALFALQESTGRLVLLFFGCWTISCSALPARRTAERLVRAANGNFPHTVYKFCADTLYVTAYDKTTEVQLSAVNGFYSDTAYWYLFLNSSSAYMVPKSSLQPTRPEAFEAFLEERTGCTRENVPSFVTLRALRRSAGVLFHKG